MIKTDELIALRKKLHQQPELSGKEIKTAQTIKQYLTKYKPDQLLENLGGHGLMATYESGKEGPHIAFRCDMDALPIQEDNDFAHASTSVGVSHKCGHDGHMAIVSGLAAIFHYERPTKGKVSLLYQPAEETGEGAHRLMEDKQFQANLPDYLFGLHNLPKVDKSMIYCSSASFAAASKGIVIKLSGKTSHAAEPQNGISPVPAVSELLAYFSTIEKKLDFSSTTFITVVHTLIGEIAFGTSPAKGEIRATLRAFEQGDMDLLTKSVVEYTQQKADRHQLSLEIDWTEVFPATANTKETFEMVKRAAAQTELSFHEMKEPFRWSEDFGHYSKKMKTGFFGLGAGEETPSLHNSDYDFPDEIIESGTRIFHQIALNLLDQ